MSQITRSRFGSGIRGKTTIANPELGSFSLPFSNEPLSFVVVGIPQGGCNLLVMAGRTGRLTAAHFVTGKATGALVRGVRAPSESEFRALVGE